MAATGKNNQGKNDSKRNNLKKNATDFKEKISNGEPMRLNKFLSDAGVCSRRQADRYVEQGRILVDGEPAQMGQKVHAGQDIRVDGKRVSVSRKQIVLAVNKPKGIVCTTEKREKDNIVDFIGYPERIYPVGRLDKDSEGLILMTNDGELMNEILKARNYHEKEYEVTINRPVTNVFLKQMSEGVEILDTVTRPCKVKRTGVYTFRIILTQGLIADYTRLNTEVVKATIVGEHGDAQIPIWSRVSIAGVPIQEYCENVGLRWGENIRKDISDKVREMGATIIKGKGRTHYGIATCVCYLAEAVLNQRLTIAPVSTMFQGEYGIEDVCLSVPSIIGVNGVEKRLEERWAEEEFLAFRQAAEKMRNVLKTL